MTPVANHARAVCSPTVALAAAACGGGSEQRPERVDRRRRRHRDLEGGARRAHRAGEEGLRVAEAGVSEGGNARVPEHPDAVRRVPRRARGVPAGGRGARHLGDREGHRRRPSRSSIDERFDGKRAEYEKALEKQGFTAEQYRENALEVSALSHEDLRRGHEGREGDRPGDPGVLHAEPVAVRHARVARRAAHPHRREGRTTRSTSRRARRRRTRSTRSSKGGADFAALAKESSADPGSKDSGGKLTITRGQTVPEFDKVSFELDTGELSQPVKTEYGYHVIEAVSDVRKATTTPIDKVRADDPRDASAGEAQRGDADVGRGPEDGLRGQGELRGRLRAAAAPGGTHRRPSRVSRA